MIKKKLDARDRKKGDPTQLKFHTIEIQDEHKKHRVIVSI